MKGEVNSPKECEVPEQEKILDLEDEDEPVDEELQKKMKNVKIDDSVFTQGQKLKDKKEEKKYKKNKGQDFLDYANKNNIAINIEYEEDKFDRKKPMYDKKQYNQQGESNQHPSNKNYNGYNKYYNKNSSNYHHQQNSQNSHNNSGNKYNNKQQGGYKSQKRTPFLFGGNKFDSVNTQKSPYDQMPYQYSNNAPNQYIPRQYSNLRDDKDILEHIHQMFSEEVLNKDLYLRYRINENGEINLNDIANYNSLSKNNVSPQKILEVLAHSTVLHVKDVEDRKMVVINDYKNLNLNTIESITEEKKQMKMQRMHQNVMMNQNPIEYNPYGPYNYIHMQNNYYIPPQGMYPMQGYTHPMYVPQQPQQVPYVQGGTENVDNENK